ncbi:Crp/Fnr family transcriptional regulator [Aquabacterium olei]|uniref:Crp/Fnr family transcriptional regulator n=1 Tax=Aquabacterium olei TaxID=1296669 RepID=A0A2U8FV10_9BURK|nr:Crp/Fnr family transcriptional regulator [Aquabacterium olei]AWI54628.1 Crp/Fnr family transcriptional regulator [Aquabacterium olei]
MKRLLDRFVSGATGGARTTSADAAEADDEGFFATQFMERPESVRGSSAWSARALAVGAQPLDPEAGLSLLMRAWGQDALMAALGEEGQRKLLPHLQFVKVPAGRELIVQGERGDYALIVLDGVVAVDRVPPAGGRVRLAEAREGEVIGEMSLLDASARFASCLTLSACALAVLTSEALDELAIEEPRLGMALMTCTARRLSLRMRQLGARLGALLDASRAGPHPV